MHTTRHAVSVIPALIPHPSAPRLVYTPPRLLLLSVLGGGIQGSIATKINEDCGGNGLLAEGS